MAEGEDKDQKTEQATDRRREQFREQGSVAQSRDLASSVTLVLTVVVLWSVVRGVAEEWFELVRRYLNAMDDSRSLAVATWSLLARTMLPIVGTSFVSAAAVGIAQFGIPQRFGPKWERLSPVTKISQLLAPKQAGKTLVKALAKLACICTVVYAECHDWQQIAGNLGHPDVHVSLGAIASLLWRIAIRVLSVFLLLGVLDWVWAKRTLDAQMRMTKEEVKREHKEDNGNPRIKSRMRALRRALAKKRMLADVKKADVVLVNPTEYAVAIRYSAKKMAAPVVVAKGVDEVALRIREVAKAANIPIVENRPLARALHAQVKVGREVPAALYRAIAEVLAFVYRQRNKKVL